MATDIDVPFLPSAAQIRRREFASVRRGYDPDQVRDYLAQVAEQVEMLEQEAREAKLQPGAKPRADAADREADAPPSEDPYERLAKRLTTLLATADKEAEGILAEARADAARMIDEARSDADRIRVDAQARAEEVRQQGNELLGARQAGGRPRPARPLRAPRDVGPASPGHADAPGRRREGARGRHRRSRRAVVHRAREGRRAEARRRGGDGARGGRERRTTTHPTASTGWRTCSSMTGSTCRIPPLELDFDDDSDD